jgi:hypothetical protein
VRIGAESKIPMDFAKLLNSRRAVTSAAEPSASADPVLTPEA